MLATTLSVVVPPLEMVTEAGCVVMVIGLQTSTVTCGESTLPQVFVTLAQYFVVTEGLTVMVSVVGVREFDVSPTTPWYQ